MGRGFGRALDDRADDLLRRLGGRGLYAPAGEGWWPHFRVSLVLYAVVVPVLVGAAALGGGGRRVPLLVLATTLGSLAWYALCSWLAFLWRSRRAQRSTRTSAPG